MVLAVDIGNTNIVLGVWKEQKLLFVSRLKTDREKTEDGYAVEIRNILEIYGVKREQVEGAIISSVVPQLSLPMSKAVGKLTGKNPLMVGPGIRTGLNILIENPAQLGSDMVVDAVAAIAKYPKPIVIIDMGTATKIFAVDKSGNFLGCSIMPGLRISLDALSERTAALPQIGVEPPKEVIGRNSVESMRSGAVYGTACMIDGMVGLFEETLGQEASIVATGGLAGDVIPCCRRKIVHDPDLTLEGLYRLYEKNRACEAERRPLKH